MPELRHLPIKKVMDRLHMRVLAQEKRGLNTTYGRPRGQPYSFPNVKT